MVCSIYLPAINGLLTLFTGIRWGPSRVREVGMSTYLEKINLNFTWQGFLFYHEKSDIHSHIYAGCEIFLARLERMLIGMFS